MTLEQKRISIAEACGWRGISEQFLVGYAPWRTQPYSDRVKSCPIGELDSIPLDPLPDYYNDLNAMHEAEEVLEGFDRAEFAVKLCRIVGADWPNGIGQGTFAHIHATASQRAEAFGKTLNLW